MREILPRRLQKLVLTLYGLLWGEIVRRGGFKKIFSDIEKGFFWRNGKLPTGFVGGGAAGAA